MSYQGREGWFKEHTTALSKGKYWLADEYDVELGEPVVRHADTGFVANPINKKKVKSYDNATAGAEEALGVSLDIKYAISGVSSDDKILRPDYYWPRDMLIMQIGICPIVNTHTGYTTLVNQTVIPSNGGCESLGAQPTGLRADKTTLGKALQDAPPGVPGLVWVNPQSMDKYPLT
jgi:hypothetical protein